MSPSFTWNDRTVREALGLRLEAARDDLVYDRIGTDSRQAGDGELYVALVGERFDGHDFVADAMAAGALGAVVSRPVAGADGIQLYPVDDTLLALGRLARYRRDRLPARVVGITGSSGKTGTKDLAAAAVGAGLRVHATAGNLNNQVGVPLTLLAAPEDAEALVVEMGTNAPGEIAVLTGIARPDLAVITTVGESHLEKLGSVEGVLKEKLDLVRGLAEGDVAIVGDRPRSLPRTARELHERVRVAGFSSEADDDLRARDVEVDHWGYHRFLWQEQRVSLQLPGRHAVVNALLALGVAQELGVEPAAAAAGVAGVEPRGMRGEVRRVGGLTLILDCYNANPQSVRAALDLLQGHGNQVRRVAVLGSMLELGERSEELHREVLDDALARPLDVVAAVGDFAAPARAILDEGGGAGGPDLVAAEEPEAAHAALRERLEGHEVVLLKASRGVALETLVPLFERDFGEGA